MTFFLGRSVDTASSVLGTGVELVSDAFSVDEVWVTGAVMDKDLGIEVDGVDDFAFESFLVAVLGRNWASRSGWSVRTIILLCLFILAGV